MLVSASAICWARQRCDIYQASLARQLFTSGVRHWSRCYEYPWVALNGDFHEGQRCLDAGGGPGSMQTLLAEKGVHVVNVDIDPKWELARKNIEIVKGDLRKLDYPDGTFPRVVCLSVLEHIEKPQEVVKELWRVLVPGGRLLVTLDVADYARWNHTVDQRTAAGLVSLFGMTVPEFPADALRQSFPETEPREGDRASVLLHVLCFWCDKPE